MNPFLNPSESAASTTMTDARPPSFAPPADQAVGTLPDWIESDHFGLTIEAMSAVGVCGVLALDPSGVITYALGTVFDPDLGPDKGVGRSLNEIFQPELTRERERVFSDIGQRGGEAVAAPSLVVDMVRGREIWWMSTPSFVDGRLAGVFAVGVHPHARATLDETAPGVHRLRHVISPGPLSTLTLGELEVLRLHAMGKRRDDMAVDLQRTVKAVERRRTTLGRKLGIDHAPELVMIGIEAGLHRMSHAALVDFSDANCGPDARPSGIRPAPNA